MKVENRDIDPKIVRAYYDHMAAVYRASIVRKDTSPIMEVARAGLCLLGIEAGKRWMEYATTDPLSRTIYVPFEPGVVNADGSWDLWAQINVLAHECQHLHQADSVGELGTIVSGIAYALDTPHRTAHEAECYVTSAEMHWWRYGLLEEWWLEHTAEGMLSYGVSDADVQHIHTHLLSAAATIRRGGIISHAGHAAIEWLDAHAPDLREAPTSPR